MFVRSRCWRLPDYEIVAKKIESISVNLVEGLNAIVQAEVDIFFEVGPINGSDAGVRPMVV